MPYRYAEEVTDLVKCGNPDDEYLPVKKCACGAEFESWDFTIGLGSEQAKACPKCGRELYFEHVVSVYQKN